MTLNPKLNQGNVFNAGTFMTTADVLKVNLLLCPIEIQNAMGHVAGDIGTIFNTLHHELSHLFLELEGGAVTRD